MWGGEREPLGCGGRHGSVEEVRFGQQLLLDKDVKKYCPFGNKLRDLVGTFSTSSPKRGIVGEAHISPSPGAYPYQLGFQLPSGADNALCGNVISLLTLGKSETPRARIKIGDLTLGGKRFEIVEPRKDEPRDRE